MTSRARQWLFGGSASEAYDAGGVRDGVEGVRSLDQFGQLQPAFLEFGGFGLQLLHAVVLGL